MAVTVLGPDAACMKNMASSHLLRGLRVAASHRGKHGEVLLGRLGEASGPREIIKPRQPCLGSKALNSLHKATVATQRK